MYLQKTLPKPQVRPSFATQVVTKSTQLFVNVSVPNIFSIEVQDHGACGGPKRDIGNAGEQNEEGTPQAQTIRKDIGASFAKKTQKRLMVQPDLRGLGS